MRLDRTHRRFWIFFEGMGWSDGSANANRMPDCRSHAPERQ
ncbi:hypothetical protein RRSWK_03818 [Rhodopirellula sp. SWK7]|nr:hypothetical protein RRSWK_03818 [Rhodopirellula sp. SWK7]